jgi:hypothetical protein
MPKFYVEQNLEKEKLSEKNVIKFLQIGCG